jgi:hypothetical protein
MLMSPYCGNGRSSWLRAMFACLENGPAAVMPKNGLGTCVLSAVAPNARYFGSSWLMLTGVSTVPPSGRWSPRAPT